MLNAETSIKQLMLECPSGQLDQCIKDQIEKEWTAEPSALQILKVLDACVHSGQGPMPTIALEMMLKHKIKEEGTTYEEVVAKATWRN